MLNEKQLNELLESLSLDELVGQVLNYEFNEKRHSHEWLEGVMSGVPIGSVYYGDSSDEFSEWIREKQEKYCRIPTMYVADVENGPGCGAPNEPFLPRPMAWGAANDPELVEQAHIGTAQRCRRHVRHLALSPVVDINFNFNNCLVNTRAVSDDTDAVIKNCVAAVRGYQKDGLMAACCKHFPGDGVDQRNQHFMTTVNTLSADEWMNTYGRVYKAMIEAGTQAIMVGHIALPAFDEKIDEVRGYPPATLSKNLMTGLLKEKLGFKGCIVSDAMCMVGAAVMADEDKLAVEFLKAGGDILLFALPTDFGHIKAAVESGDLPLERLKDAVLRVLRMKNFLGLFGEEEQIQQKLATEQLLDVQAIADTIAEKSVTLIRNAKGLFPQKNLKKGTRVLQAVIQKDGSPTRLTTIESELRARGCEVTVMVNPKHPELKDAAEKYDLVLICMDIDANTYLGGTLRIGWEQAMTFWRGYLTRNKNIVFASFGDPYKLYDYPFAETYINMYSYVEASQRAFLKALYGEIEPMGKSPVAFEGYFERGI